MVVKRQGQSLVPLQNFLKKYYKLKKNGKGVKQVCALWYEGTGRKSVTKSLTILQKWQERQKTKAPLKYAANVEKHKEEACQETL